MTLNSAKENAIIQWYNTLAIESLGDLIELSSGSRLLELCNIFIPELKLPEPPNLAEGVPPRLAPEYAAIKLLVDEYFHIKSDEFLDYPECAVGNKMELAKLTVLLLSIVVLQYIRTENSALATLTHLDPETQQDIEEILSVTVNSSDELRKSEIQRVLSRPAKSKRSPRKMVGTTLTATTPVQKGILGPATRNRKKLALEVQDEIVTSPLQTFLNSPKTQEWAQVLTKNKEVIRLKSELYVKDIENENLKLQIKNLEKDLETRKKEEDHQKTKYHTWEVAAENAEKDLKEQLEQEKKHFTNVVDDYNKKISALQAENEQLKSELEEMNNREEVQITKTTTDLNMNKKVLELEVILDEKSRNIENLQGIIDGLKTNIEHQACVISMHEERLSKVLEEVQINKVASSPGERMSDVYEADYKNLLDKWNEMKNYLNQSQGIIMKFKKKNFNLREEKNSQCQTIEDLHHKQVILSHMLYLENDKGDMEEDMAKCVSEASTLRSDHEVVENEDERILKSDSENLSKSRASENTESGGNSDVDVADGVYKTLRQLSIVCNLKNKDVFAVDPEKRERILKIITNEEFVVGVQLLKQLLLNGFNGFVTKRMSFQSCEYLNGASSTVRALREENAELKQKISDCLNFQEVQTCNIQELQQHCTNLEKLYEEKEDNVNYLQDKLKKYKQYSVEVYKLQEKYGALKKAYSDLENTNQELTEKNTSQFKLLNRLMAENKKLEAEIAREKDAKKNVHARIIGLQFEVSRLSSENKRLSKNLEIEEKKNLKLSEDIKFQLAVQQDNKKDKDKIVSDSFKRSILALNNKKRNLESAKEGKGLTLTLDSRVTISEEKEDTMENESFVSNKSLCEPLFNKSLHGTLPLFNDDEEGYFNHSSLMERKKEIFNLPLARSNCGRLRELQRRNTLCLPHLRSTYPVELQGISPAVMNPGSLMKPSTSKTSETKVSSSKKSFTQTSKHRLINHPLPKKRKTSDGESSSCGINREHKPFTPAKKYTKVMKTPSSLKRLLYIQRMRANKEKTSFKA